MNSALPTSIDEYIASCPAQVQATLHRIRATIRTAAPDAVEAIKYRMPTFVLGENVVHFAVFKHHVGFYPTSSGIKAFRRELKGYVNSKGAVQFPMDQPVPFGLIKRMVQFRVKEARARMKAKPQKKQ